MAVDKKDPNVVATGGADSVAMLFNKSSGKVVGTLAGHKKKVSQPTQPAALLSHGHALVLRPVWYILSEDDNS